MNRLLKKLSYYPPALMYHTFDESFRKTATYVPIETFQEQIDILKRFDYKVLEPELFVEKFATKSLAKKELVITFDDGFKDNLKAIEILAKYDIPAVIFVIYDRLDTAGYLSKSDLLDIRKNSRVKISTHTLEHNYLPNCDTDYAKKTIAESKANLEEIIGEKLDLFSYPIGGYNDTIIEIVKDCGFKGAFATNRGWGENQFCIKRVNVNERDRGLKFLHKLSGYYWVNRPIKATC